MYRLSERKARYIGEVSRVLKENAVDCLLNIEQTNFMEEKFDEKLNDIFHDLTKIPFFLSFLKFIL